MINRKYRRSGARVILKYRKAIALNFMLILMFCGTQIYAGIIKGIVYQDNNRNNSPDVSEPRLEGVVVSNGKDFVVTDKNGEFVMDELKGDHIIYASLPDGFWYQDRFYREVSVPEEGSVSAEWGLVPQKQKTPFYFAQFADLHLKESNTEFARLFVKRMNSLEPTPAFVVGAGDLVYDVLKVTNPETIEQLYRRYVDFMSPLRVPLFNVPGNHEHAGWAKKELPESHPLYGLGAYRKFLGPPWYSFNYAGHHIAMIDAHIHDPEDSLGYKDRVSEEVTEWLKNDLSYISREKPIILFLHPRLRSSWEIATLLESYNLKSFFFGHGHSHLELKSAGAIGYESPDLGSYWGENIHGYLLCRVTDGGIEVFKDAITRRHNIELRGVPKGYINGELSFTTEFMDPHGEIISAFAGIDEQIQDVEFSRVGYLGKFEAIIDTTQFIDGFHHLWVGCRDREQTYAIFEPVRLENGNKNPPVDLDESAVVQFSACSIGAPHEVYLDGEKLASLTKGAASGSDIVMELSPDQLSDTMTFTFKAFPKKPEDEYPDDLGIDVLRVIYKGRAYMSDRDYQRIGGEKGAPSVDFRVRMRDNDIPAFSERAPVKTKMEILEAGDGGKVVKVQTIGPGNRDRAASMFDSSTIYADGTPAATIYHKCYNVLYCWPVPAGKTAYSVTVRKNDLTSVDVQN